MTKIGESSGPHVSRRAFLGGARRRPHGDGDLARPAWRPCLPDRSGTVTGEFRMVDFLTFTGVDPTSRGQ